MKSVQGKTAERDTESRLGVRQSWEEECKGGACCSVWIRQCELGLGSNYLPVRLIVRPYAAGYSSPFVRNGARSLCV